MNYFSQGLFMVNIKKILFLFFMMLFIFSCSKEDKPAVAEVKTVTENLVITEIVDLTPVEIPEYKQAMITFISGDVFLLENGEWIYAEIGEFLEEDDSIQVETGSFCEIQFGDRAVIRVEENTELALNTINLKPGNSTIGIELVLGSVLCKVQKLTDNDRFNVKTQSVACGVRGTEFSVKSEPGKDTVLAVKEGFVAILPPELIVEDLIERAGESGETVAVILKEIDTAAFIVKADEEISLNEGSFEEIEETVKEITEIIELLEVMEVDTDSKKEVPASIVKALTAASKIVTATVVTAAVPLEEISAPNIAKLDKAEEMRMIDIPVASEIVEPDEKIFLHKFSLKIIPANAEIILNSKTVGKGSLSGVFEEGEILNFKFVSNNFESQSMSFIVSEETSKQYIISLDKTKVEPEAKNEEEEVSPVKEEEPAVDTTEEKIVEIKEEAKHIDSVVAEVSIEKKNTILNIEPEFVNPEPIAATLSISESKLVGSVSIGANMIYTSDSKGLISAVTPEGRLVWSFASANKSVENSYPVFSNNRIYFSGSSEFVILNASNGKIIGREALDKNSAHIFGRRMVPFGSISLFPSNEEIRVLNSSSGDLVRSISLPGSGSRMTPAVWRNKILSVDQNGTLSVINPDNGSIEKEITSSGSQPIALSITIKNNLAVFSGRKGNVVCIDLNAEKVLWETQLNSGGRKVQVYSDIVSSNYGVYIYTKGTIHALDLNTGKKLFENISNVSSPPCVINNQLVFGDNNNNLVFMNSENGRIDKILYLNDTVSARPAALGGLIAAGTFGGKLLVINPEGIQ